MGIPFDKAPLAPTDDEPVSPAPAPPDQPLDPEAPLADALDQAQEVAPGWRFEGVTRDSEVSEADALDQALAAPLDDEDDD
jgi:hypothetical protein